MKGKKYRKVIDRCHYTGKRNLISSVPKQILVVFHNGSNYDYYFIITELAKEFQKQFTCLGKNIEKYIAYAALIEVTMINDRAEETTKNISYILQFIDGVRVMVSSLLNLVNNRSERIHRIKCKYRHDEKNFET